MRSGLEETVKLVRNQISGTQRPCLNHNGVPFFFSGKPYNHVKKARNIDQWHPRKDEQRLISHENVEGQASLVNSPLLRWCPRSPLAPVPFSPSLTKRVDHGCSTYHCYPIQDLKETEILGGMRYQVKI